MDVVARFAKLISRAEPRQGVIYRSTTPKYANTSDLLTGEGSRLKGGRWNPAGIAAVYGSFTPRTALEECLAHANYYDLPVQSSMPRTFIAVEFELTLVLDLTEGRNRQAIGISEARLTRCDWRAEAFRGETPITQQVGHAAFQAGLEAILVPSAADSQGRNLVVFVDNLRNDSRLAIVAPERL